MKTLANPSYEENKMKLRYAMSGIVLLGSSASAASTSAQPPKDVMEIVREGDINWMASRFGADLPIAILAGDPSKPGPYVMRVKFAPGHMSKPHFHKETRYRSEEHTSELQSLMRNSYAVFCLTKKKQNTISQLTNNTRLARQTDEPAHP